MAIQNEKKENPNKNAELSMEQKANNIYGVVNYLPPLPVSDQAGNRLPEVKPPTEKKRSRERER